MWDVKKYKGLINTIKENGRFMGNDVTTKEQIYELIGKTIYVDAGTAKSWGRPSSNGPGSNDLLIKLEKAFGIDEGLLGRKEYKDVKEDKQNIKLTDFNKQAIHNCYMLMKDYIHSDEVENEDCFADMCAEVGKYKIAIPEKIYGAIQKCIDEYLAPIVYEYYDTFEKCFADDIGFMGDDGTWHVRDEEGMKKTCMYFVMTIIEIEEKVDRFAMETLYPVLIA